MSDPGRTSSLDAIGTILSATFGLTLPEGWAAQPLAQLGLDSLHLVELQMELESHFGRNLLGNAVVDNALAERTAQQLAQQIDALLRA